MPRTPSLVSPPAAESDFSFIQCHAGSVVPHSPLILEPQLALHVGTAQHHNLSRSPSCLEGTEECPFTGPATRKRP